MVGRWGTILAIGLILAAVGAALATEGPRDLRVAIRAGGGTSLEERQAQNAANTAARKRARERLARKRRELRGEDGARGARGARGAQGAAGTAGAAGPQGIPGAPGQDGRPGAVGPTGPPGPLLDELPPGRTLRGHFAVWGFGMAGMQATASLSFPLPLPSKPTSGIVLASSAPSKECPGTAEEPEAAPGHVCIYPSVVEEADALSVLHGDRFGLDLRITSLAAIEKPFGSSGTWAATAPGEIGDDSKPRQRDRHGGGQRQDSADRNAGGDQTGEETQREPDAQAAP
jgi:hypothetical protein